MKNTAMTRFEKLDYLLENPFLDKKVITDCMVLRLLVREMSEDDFNSFYASLCQHLPLECFDAGDEMVFSA